MSVIKTVKRTTIAVVLTAGVTATVVSCMPNGKVHHSEGLTPIDVKHYVDHDAVLDALSETPQFVGLTGDVSKTVKLSDDKWFGDKTYQLTLNGEFKLGVDSKDIKITTKGNTVVVQFPQPKIISVDLPYDQAEIKQDVGKFRNELTNGDMQQLYSEARKGAISDIKVNIKAKEKAADAVEHTLEDLIETVPYVDNVIFAD